MAQGLGCVERDCKVGGEKGSDGGVFLRERVEIQSGLVVKKKL